MAVNNFVGTCATAALAEWNTATNWLLDDMVTQRIPISTDDCTFTGIVAPVVPLTITTTTAYAKSVDFSTAGAAFTLSGTPSIFIYGSLVCKPGMTWNHNGILYSSYRSTGSITSNSVVIGSQIFFSLATGTTISLVDNLATNVRSVYIFNSNGAGVFDSTNGGAGNYSITCSIFGDNSTAGIVTLTLGSSTINCSNVSFAAATLTVTANTAAINITSTVDITANFGGQTWGGTTTVLMTGGKVLTLNGANTFGNFTISWTTNNHSSILALGADQVISGTFTLTGSTTISRPQIRSGTVGTQRTITVATVTVTGAEDWQDIKGAGAGSWDLSAINSGNLGGNSNITFRVAQNWYADCGTSTPYNWYDNIWAHTSGGGPGGTDHFPLPQDTAYIDDLTWDATGKTLNINSSRLPNIDASGLSEANTLNLSVVVHYGDLILTGSGVTVTSTGGTSTLDARLKSEASDILDINILPSIGSGNIIIGVYAGQVGTVRLLTNNLTSTGTFTLVYGTFDLNGKTLSCGIFSSSNSNTRVLQSSAAGGKIAVTGVSATPFLMTTDTTGLTVQYTGAFYPINIDTPSALYTADVTIALPGTNVRTFGDLTILAHTGDFDTIITGVTGHTFGAITLGTPDATHWSDIQFTAGTTLNISSFVAVGCIDHTTNVKSVTSATHTLSDTTGTNTVNYCTIAYSIATGGASWRTVSCIDGLNNTGWIFGAVSTAMHYYQQMRA